MSCPRDVRPDEDGWGYGDLHGTEEYPSISLLTGRCEILFVCTSSLSAWWGSCFVGWPHEDVYMVE